MVRRLGNERILGIVLVLASVVVTPCAFAQRLPVRTYTTSDGLPHNHVNAITIDSRGFLWAATDGGLSRFDGYGFTNYGTREGLPSATVSAFLESGDSTLWVGTDRGLCRFLPDVELKAPQFEMVPFRVEAGRLSVHALTQDASGTLWVGTNVGLFRLDPGGGASPARVDLGVPQGNESAGPPSIHALLFDRGGSLWIATRVGLFRRLPEGSVEHYAKRNGLPADVVLSLLEDREGNIWLGSEWGVCRLVAHPAPDRSVVSWLLTQQSGFPPSWVFALHQTQDGVLWVGTSGLGRMSTSGDRSTFRLLGKAEGIRNAQILSLAEDPEGNLWVGGDGLTKIAHEGFVTYDSEDATRQIGAANDGEIFLYGEKHGLARFTGSALESVRLRLPREIGYMGWGWDQLILQDHAGIWWLPTGSGLCRYPRGLRLSDFSRELPERIYTKRDGLISDNLFRLFEDSRGDLWLSFMADPAVELERWDRRTDRFQTFSEKDGLPASLKLTPSVFAEDRAGAIWAGLYDGGLLRYRNGRFSYYSESDGVPEGLIDELHIDATGRLWIVARTGGVATIEDPTASSPHCVLYRASANYEIEDARTIDEDVDGRIYVGHARGVDRIDPKTGNIRHFTVADGLKDSAVALSYCDREHDLWFVSLLGISRLTPRPERPPTPPKILVTGLRIAGSPGRMSALGETRVPDLTLGPDQQNIEIDYVSVALGSGERLRYQTKLEGADTAWSEPTGRRTITYANLAPGSYRFVVRALSTDGILSEQPATFAFEILVPVYRRAWFLALAGAALLGSAAALYRRRVARLLELERVRSRIALDLHDDLGSALSQVAILSEVALRAVGEAGEGAASPLRRIAAVSREMITALSDLVWSIDPQRDRAADLTRRMRRFAEEVCSGRGVELTMTTPREERAASTLDPDVRRQVLLVFKEAVHNAVRHSGCSNVVVDMKIDRPWLRLSVADDGSGIVPETGSEGHGLAGMVRRARSVSGTCEITSKPGGGTTIRLEVPLVKPRTGRNLSE